MHQPEYSFERIYLDYNATTPIDPRVLEVFFMHVREMYGNPSSIHKEGQKAKNALKMARKTIAEKLFCKENEIIFTASATEAINLFLRGLLVSLQGKHVVTSSIEHASVYDTCRYLASNGVEVTWLTPSSPGEIELHSIQAAVKENTQLIVLSAANSETGIRSDIRQIGDFALSRNIWFFVDAVQLLGKAETLFYPTISGMAISAHKIYGPKGVAALLLRETLPLVTQITGGGQERNRRSGTENVAAIASFAEAVRCIDPEYEKKVSYLRDYFEEEVLKRIECASINGKGLRIANTSNICFDGVMAEELVLYLDLHNIAVSYGSACSSGAREPSRVLLQMGLSQKKALSSIRFSLGKDTTIEQLQEVLCILEKAITALKG